MPPCRYSHSCHLIDNLLVLVGGVGFSHWLPGVAMVHLPSGSSAEFALPVSMAAEMLFYHQILLDQTELQFKNELFRT